MVRPIASDVSTLSGCVAKGHQTVHLVSSTPSKIPYGGFSPVRLQTSLRRSHLRMPLDLLIGCHCFGWAAFGVFPPSKRGPGFWPVLLVPWPLSPRPVLLFC